MGFSSLRSLLSAPFGRFESNPLCDLRSRSRGFELYSLFQTDEVGLTSLRSVLSAPFGRFESNPLCDLRSRSRGFELYSLFQTDEVGFEPTRTMSTRFPIVRLKPLGHSSPLLRTGAGLTSLRSVLSAPFGRSESNPLCAFLRNARGFEFQGPNCLHFNGGSGIRTHAVLPPTP